MLNETNANDKSIKIKVPKPFVYIVLQNGYCVPKTLSDSIKDQIESILPALIPGVEYTLKILCGNEYWSQLSVGARIMAGRFMANLVESNGLPLSFGDDTGSHSKTYRAI